MSGGTVPASESRPGPVHELAAGGWRGKVG